ncbi:MAG: thioredoxin fold domain-containing protein [Planctomycetes bacterium]|nr:thioredoxin fold domain-containing protein [Planctomycetota bacterium]
MFGLRHYVWFAAFVLVASPLTHDELVGAESPRLISDLNGRNFTERVLKRKGLVLVVFRVNTCRFCRAAEPDIEELASTMRMTVVVGQVDADASSALAKKYSVRSVPTFMLFKDGKQVHRQSGYRKEDLFKLLYKHSDVVPARSPRRSP